MNQEKIHNIALMRYSAIAPLISGTGNDYPSLDAFFRAVSNKGVLHPDGHLKHYAQTGLKSGTVNILNLDLIPSSLLLERIMVNQ